MPMLPHLSVFIFEKIPVIYTLLNDPLSKEGCRVHHFSKTDGFVSQMDQLAGGIPALILIDFSTEGDPIQLLRDIKAETHSMDVIMIADEPNHDLALESMRSLSCDFIVKPIDPISFINTMKERLENLPFQGFQNLRDYQSKKTINLISREAQEKHLLQYFQTRTGKPWTMADRLAEAFSKSPEIVSPKPTILLVDDEDNNRFTVSLLLEDHYTILEASDGQIAIDMAPSHPEIAVILLDVRMPNLNGDLALPRLKKLCPDAEIIMLTGYKETDIAVRTLKLGACDYLNKQTADKTLMIEKIEAALRIRKQNLSPSGNMDLGDRYDLFEAFCSRMADVKKPVCYEDVRVFFPEAEEATTHLRHTPIDPEAIKGSKSGLFVNDLIQESIVIRQQKEGLTYSTLSEHLRKNRE